MMPRIIGDKVYFNAVALPSEYGHFDCVTCHQERPIKFLNVTMWENLAVSFFDMQSLLL
jgi:hypothetical protein